MSVFLVCLFSFSKFFEVKKKFFRRCFYKYFQNKCTLLVGRFMAELQRKVSNNKQHCLFVEQFYNNLLHVYKVKSKWAGKKEILLLAILETTNRL